MEMRPLKPGRFLFIFSPLPKQSLPRLLSSASQQSLGSGVSSGHSNILLNSARNFLKKYMLKKKKSTLKLFGKEV